MDNWRDRPEPDTRATNERATGTNGDDHYWRIESSSDRFNCQEERDREREREKDRFESWLKYAKVKPSNWEQWNHQIIQMLAIHMLSIYHVHTFYWSLRTSRKRNRTVWSKISYTHTHIIVSPSAMRRILHLSERYSLVFYHSSRIQYPFEPFVNHFG